MQCDDIVRLSFFSLSFFFGVMPSDQTKRWYSITVVEVWFVFVSRPKLIIPALDILMKILACSLNYISIIFRCNFTTPISKRVVSKINYLYYGTNKKFTFWFSSMYFYLFFSTVCFIIHVYCLRRNTTFKSTVEISTNFKRLKVWSLKPSSKHSLNKKPTCFDGHLITMVLRLTCQRVSSLHVKLHYEVLTLIWDSSDSYLAYIIWCLKNIH